jgi:hypothetical protein
MQRVADTRLGSLMMLIFIPAMIISGVLTVDWKNGHPSINIDRAKAKELKAKAENGLTQWSQDGRLQQWRQNVQNAWQQAHQANDPSSNQAGWFQSQNHAQTGRPMPSTSASPPPGTLTGYGQTNQVPASGTPSPGTWGGWNSTNNTAPAQFVDNNNPTNYGNNYNEPNYPQASYPANNYNQPTTNPPAYPAQNGTPNSYNQPSYSQPSYSQPSYSAPNYSQPGTWQPNTATQTNYGQPVQAGNISNPTRPAWLR